MRTLVWVLAATRLPAYVLIPHRKAEELIPNAWSLTPLWETQKEPEALALAWLGNEPVDKRCFVYMYMLCIYIYIYTQVCKQCFGDELSGPRLLHLSHRKQFILEEGTVFLPNSLRPVAYSFLDTRIYSKMTLWINRQEIKIPVLWICFLISFPSV